MSKSAPPTLIDEIYRSTFDKDAGSLVLNLRQQLFQARRFVLDERMSSFLADLSVAAFPKRKNIYATKAHWHGHRAAVEQLRRGARLPHRLTWIEYDLFAECMRHWELQDLINNNSKPERGLVPEIEGWLLEQHPTIDTAFRAMLFSKSTNYLPAHWQNASNRNDTLFMFPWAYTWVTDDREIPFAHLPNDSELIEVHSEPTNKTYFPPLSGLALGMMHYDSPHVGIVPLAPDHHAEAMLTLLKEWTGVVRRMWALLSTINDIPVTFNEVRASKGFIGGHQYRRYLDHRTITLNVPTKKDMRVVARHVVALARKMAHMVRGHWRIDWRHRPSILCQHEWKDDNTCAVCKGHRLWITEHQRGDPALGIVMTDYRVEHPTL